MTDAVKVNVLLTENMMELEKQLLTGKIVLIGPLSDTIVLTELGLLTVIGKWLLKGEMVQRGLGLFTDNKVLWIIGPLQLVLELCRHGTICGGFA